jgi:hypothetical protein
MNKIVLSIIIILLIIVAGVFFWQNQPVNQVVISNFEECVAAGNPVMESYPEQCRTADGQLFVRELPNDNVNIEIPASVVDQVKAVLVQRLAVDESEILIGEVSAQDWSDSCLGVGRADEICAQMITPGYLVTAEIDGVTYIYRTNEDGSVIREERE